MRAQQSWGDHRPLVSLAGAIGCAVAFAACGGPTSPTPAPSPPAPIAGDRLKTTVSATRHALETYWSQHFSAVSSNVFFPAEDGIRYLTVTGVQTCALPI